MVAVGRPKADSARPFHVLVLVGSTREHRVGAAVAEWFVAKAKGRDDMTLDVADLADIPLPYVQQRLPAATGRYDSPAVEEFSRRIDAADGIVVVTPEYNSGYPASLKLAIDSVGPEWWAKPVGFVSYGGLASGLRAVAQLREVFGELEAVPIRLPVCFDLIAGEFADGGPAEAAGAGAAAHRMLDRLIWWAAALRGPRAAWRQDPGRAQR